MLRQPHRRQANPEAARAALQKELQTLSSWVKKKRGRLSASFVDVDSGQVLAELSPQLSLNPASNVKLLTAAAVLDSLGPGRRFRTIVYGDIRQGTASRLALKGDGDPDLRAEHLDGLAHQLVQQGLKRVAGDVVVDASAFDAKILPPGYAAQPKESAAFRAPVWAVSVDRNAVTVFVTPAAEGEPARVWATPIGAVTVVGTVSTGPRGSGQKVRLNLQQQNGRVTAVVGGSIAAGLSRQRFRRRVADPTLWAGVVFAQSLRRAGIAVPGRVRAGKAAGPVLAQRESQPVRVLLHALGKKSDNFVAEMLLKSLGAQASGRPGSSADGAAAAEQFAKKFGLPASQVKVNNGSGLFDGGRASARALTTLLAGVYRDPRLGPEFMAQLSIGGVDGTLRSRFRAQARSRRVRAKTGTLARVIALSGYVLRDKGQGPVAFSLLAEGTRASHAQVRAGMDRVVQRALAP